MDGASHYEIDNSHAPVLPNLSPIRAKSVDFRTTRCQHGRTGPDVTHITVLPLAFLFTQPEVPSVTSPAISPAADNRRRLANEEALGMILNAYPVLVDIAAAIEVVPEMTPTTILTSGAPLDWAEYTGGQRRAILYSAVYEGLARTIEEAATLLDRGDIRVRSTQEFNCVGSVAGIYTASMPVFVVRDENSGSTAFCNFYEGKSRHRLNYGSFNQEVVDGLRWLETTMAPILRSCLRESGPIALRSMMAKALRMGDELHSRNTAATLLFERELTAHLFKVATHKSSRSQVEEVLRFFAENDYAFLRLSMAAAKATADAAHGVKFSSLITGQVISCRDYSIRVSGLGNTWFRGEHPKLEGKFFEGFTANDAEWIGGESCYTELVGLGAMAQLCAPSLMNYQGGSFEAMAAHTESMYEISLDEHDHFRIPSLDFRGTPVGVDLFSVIATNTTPLINGGLAGKGGGQIGAGILRPQMGAFTEAMTKYTATYLS